MFLFGVLAFWISMLDELGASRWILVTIVVGMGVAVVIYLRRQPDRDSDAKQATKAGPSV